MYGKVVELEINKTKIQMFVPGIPAMTDEDFMIKALRIIINEAEEQLKRITA